MAGEIRQNGFGLEGRVMHKSLLIPKAMTYLSGKRCAEKPARIVWEGGNGEGPFRYLAGALLHLEQGKGVSPTYCYTRSQTWPYC